MGIMAPSKEHTMRTGRLKTLPINTKAKRAYLKALSEGWSDAKAARETGISIQRWHRYKKKYPSFVKRCEQAEEVGIKALEDAATKRAVHGVLRPIVNQGRIVTFVREYSDQLLGQALKVRSSKYAINHAAGGAFEDTYAGAAEQLQSRLSDLFDALEAERIEGLKAPVR